MNTITKGPFLGINNRLPDFALHVDKTGDFLRDAVNVDVDNAGRLNRRAAAALVSGSPSNAHSLYMTSATDGYMVLDSVLYTVTLPGYTATSIHALASNEPMSYAEISGRIYFSNGVDSGRLVGSVVLPMALPTPAAPVTTGGIGGDLPAGKYRVAVAYCNAAGEEGGVSPSFVVDTVATGGLRVTLPAATSGATHVNIYLTAINGGVLMLATSALIGLWPTVDVIAEPAGAPAMQRHEMPLPAGRLFAFQGALCSHKGNDVFEGLPFRPGYCLQVGSRIPFVGDVSNVVPTENGVYVVADETFWLAGPAMTKAERVSPILPYGGVTGTAFEVPGDGKQVGWFGDEGIVIGDKLGQVKAVMTDNIDLEAPSSGNSMVFTDRGYLRVVSCGWCLNLENLRATRYTDFDFTSLSGDYGTKEDGIYALSATGKVNASVSLGKEDFGTEAKKALPAVYLGVQSEAPMLLNVSSPKQGSYSYSARSYNADALELHRVDPGKGLSATWYDLSIANVDGSDFIMASVSFAPVASTRRI